MNECSHAGTWRWYGFNPSELEKHVERHPCRLLRRSHDIMFCERGRSSGSCGLSVGTLPAAYGAAHPPLMFYISEAAAIQAIFHERGEFSAAVEQGRLYPGITDTEQVRECVRTIAGWKPAWPLRPGHPTLD